MTPPVPPSTLPVPLSRRRRVAIWALVVVASLIGLVSVLTVWTKRQLLDNEAWASSSEELIQDPEIRSALSVYLVNELYDNVDVAATLEERLPPDLQPLAGPLAGALRQPTTNGVEFLLGRPRVQQLWINASTLAHQKAINVLKDETGFGISTGEGVVTLDLRELVRQLGIDLGLPAAVVDRLPPDAGVITVLESDELSAAQGAVRAIEVLSVWLGVLVLGLFALAVYLARGMRRETLRNIGWAFVLVGLVVLVVRRGTGNYAIEALMRPENRDEGQRAWLISSSILGEIGRAAVIYGLVTVLGTTLAGPTAAGTAVRRWTAPVLNDRPGVAWSSTGAAFLLLVLWGPTHALRTWWGILILGALLAAGVAALRRQTQEEFPDARPPRLRAAATPNAGARARAARSRRSSRGSTSCATPASSPATSSTARRAPRSASASSSRVRAGARGRCSPRRRPARSGGRASQHASTGSCSATDSGASRPLRAPQRPEVGREARRGLAAREHDEIARRGRRSGTPDGARVLRASPSEGMALPGRPHDKPAA